MNNPTLRKRVAKIIRSIMREDDACSDSYIILAFDAAAALDYIHGDLADGYRPGIGSNRGRWLEIDPWRRERLRKLSAETLRLIVKMSYRVGDILSKRID